MEEVKERMNKKNVWKKTWNIGAGILIIFLVSSSLTAASLGTNIGTWQLIVHIRPDEHQTPPFHEGEIEFCALVKNSEFSTCSTPPLNYEIWVDQLVNTWQKIPGKYSGVIGSLPPGGSYIIDDLDWYFSDPGLFRVCIKVTADDTVIEDSCPFLVLPPGPDPNSIPQDLSEFI
jgi:hypothetical protein